MVFQFTPIPTPILIWDEKSPIHPAHSLQYPPAISIIILGMEHLPQPTGLPTFSAHTQAQQASISLNVLERFITYMTQFRNNHLREGVKNIYGRHYAVKAAPEYKFKEQWQANQRREFQENNYYEIIQSEATPAYVYSACLLFLQVGLIWYYSTYRLLQTLKWQVAELILAGSMVGTCLDVSLRFHLKYIKTGAMIQPWEVVRTFKESLLLLAYYTINLILINLSIYSEHGLLYCLDLIAVMLLVCRAKGLYRHFKIRSYTTPYKSYFKIFDLLSNIIAIEHCFALLIYLVSFYDIERNWLMRYGQPEADCIQRYFYSFYFTSTTIFTIGYGDLVPVNNMEILCVLAMQMLGIAHFSYLINEIGYTLSSIRKEEQQLEQNISTLSKMCKYNRIDQDLKNLAKEHLLHNQRKFQEIQPEEENRVLMKLNDELRETLLHKNRLNIIKSSLFFICHWTKNLQTEVAKRLIKRILVPNEPVLQAVGKERIYIITSGKVEIYTHHCLGFKRHFKKLLKTIQPRPQMDIAANVYGYTALISGKPVKLEAFSKDFTCVYSIDRAGFMQCVHQNKLDMEYYFEIKSKLELSRYIEEFEAPAILNIRQHYRPSQMFLIKRNIHRLKKYKNRRRDCQRTERTPTVTCTRLLQNYTLHACQEFPTTSNEIRLTFYDYNPHEDSCPSGKKLSFNQDRSLNEQTGVSRQPTQSLSKQFLLCSRFQAMKEYHKYYKRFNMTTVLQKLEKSTFMSMDYVQPMRHYQPTEDHAITTLKRVAPTKYFRSGG